MSIAPNMALRSNFSNLPTGQGQAPTEITSPEHLQRIVNCIQTELRVLNTEHATILKRIRMIKQTVAGLADLFGPDVIPGDLQILLSARPSPAHHAALGLTDICRQLLRNNLSHPLTVREILVRVRAERPNMLAHHKHPINSLRVILRRLVTYGEAIKLRNDEGVTTWKAVTNEYLGDNHSAPK